MQLQAYNQVILACRPVTQRDTEDISIFLSLKLEQSEWAKVKDKTIIVHEENSAIN